MPLLEGFCRSAVVSDSCTAFMKSPAVSAFCTLMTSPSLDLIGMPSLLHECRLSPKITCTERALGRAGVNGSMPQKIKTRMS